MYKVYGIAILGIVCVGIMLFVVPHFTAVSYQAVTVDGENKDTLALATSSVVAAPPVDARSVVEHVPLPQPMKAIYMTSCVAGTPSFRDKVIAVATATEVNTIVIDIKDFSGTLSFLPTDKAWLPAWESARCGARDMKELVARLHQAGIFVIGRITVFQDPFAAEAHPEWAVKKADGVTVWRDRKGLSFIDVAAKPYWDHIVNLAVDSYNLGFDELNFDYVRYPSDGDMQNISFVLSNATPYGHDKPANLEAFFKYLNEQLDDPKKFSAVIHKNTGRPEATPYTSADLFGMTTSNYDDLSIGQVLERAVPYFDAVAPMVYPSHYPPNFIGLANPNTDPYKVVRYAMGRGVERMVATTTAVDGFLHTRIGTTTPPIYSKPVYSADKLRTWIQDFNYGGTYDAAAVRAQFQASYDAGVTSWMIWSPSNHYTMGALEPS